MKIPASAACLNTCHNRPTHPVGSLPITSDRPRKSATVHNWYHTWTGGPTPPPKIGRATNITGPHRLQMHACWLPTSDDLCQTAHGANLTPCRNTGWARKSWQSRSACASDFIFSCFFLSCCFYLSLFRLSFCLFSFSFYSQPFCFLLSLNFCFLPARHRKRVCYGDVAGWLAGCLSQPVLCLSD